MPIFEPKIEVFIGRDALETIAVFDDDYPHLHNILKSHAIIRVDLNDTELDEILSDGENDFSQFCLRNDIQVVPFKEYFSSLRENMAQIADRPHAIFFFNIPISEANELSSKYGVIVQSEMDIQDNALQLLFRKNLDKGEIVTGASDGWSNLLKEIPLPPINSLIISDNYLLKNVDNGAFIGFENLKMLLNAILPNTLDITFHILIVTRMHNNLSPQKANKLYEELKSYLRRIRSYNFQLEFVFNPTIHPRKIFSNYFVIIGDRGFNLFHPKYNTKVHSDNQISISSILHDTINVYGDTVLAISSKDLKKIWNSYIELREQITNEVNYTTKMIIGDITPDKHLRNRLIN